MQKKFEGDLTMKMLEERKSFQQEVVGWIARLHGIEAAVTSKFIGNKYFQSENIDGRVYCIVRARARPCKVKN